MHTHQEEQQLKGRWRLAGQRHSKSQTRARLTGLFDFCVLSRTTSIANCREEEEEEEEQQYGLASHDRNGVSRRNSSQWQTLPPRPHSSCPIALAGKCIDRRLSASKLVANFKFAVLFFWFSFVFFFHLPCKETLVLCSGGGRRRRRRRMKSFVHISALHARLPVP